MRCLVILFALLALGACNSGKQRAADQIFLKKQLDIIQLLQKVSQPVLNQELQQLGTNYDIGSNSHQYSNPIIVKYYAGAVKAGLVQPQGTAFSTSISQLRKEVSLLYRILLAANDYDTFLKTAAWARVHVNAGQFVKALSAAVLVREDTQGIILPPSYEVLPQLHLDSRIIQEAQQITTLGISQATQNILIPVNYSAVVSPTEQQLAYFSQDPGLANYYAYINLIQYILGQQQESQPQPLTQQQYQQQIVGQYLKAGQDQQSTIGHGAQFLFLHQQLLAHYELNRLSNGLGPIGNIDWTNVQAPYQPHLRNLNGLEFPGRSQNLQLQQQKKQLVKLVMSLEQRLMEAIDSGHVITPQGIFLSLYQPQGVNILGDLIEGCGRSVNPRYYGSLQAVAKKLLGNAPEVENIWDYTPSALELGQTAVRDPAFYLLFKKIVNIFNQYQESLPAYQFNDLVLPGVTIQNVEISQLVTLFNDDYIDLDAVTIQPGQTQQQQVQQHVMAHLKRLDHKPYQYQIVVHSEQSVPNAVVRVYLGPKFDYNGKPVSISHNRQLFVQLDQFIQSLQLGQNIITRNSQQAPGQSHDWPCVQNILNRVNGAIRSQEPFFITEPQQIFSFPARLSLPKGQPQGYPLQLLVVISAPGPQNVPHGPVIPEQQLTFQQQQFQIVNPDQYEQMKQQQAQLPLSAGIQQNLEVLPENWSTVQQQIEVLRNHYANVYTKYHGQYPNTQIQNPVGLGQDMVYRVKGVASVPGAAVPLAAISPLSLAGQQIGGQGQQQMQSSQMQSQVPQQQYQQAQMTGQQAGGLPSQWHIPQGVQGQVLGQGLAQNLPGGQGTLAGQGLQGQQGLGVQGMQHAMQQGIQGVQQGVQGLRGVPASLLGAQAGIQGVQQVLSVPVAQPITIPYGRQGVAGVSAQSWQNLIQRIGIGSSGQQHNGGFQGIYGQPQTVQDQSVSDYFQNKQISEIIGGAISLDGKPLGWPLDRPLTAGALSVPNIFAMDVLVYHEGQPTNDITQ